MNDDELLDGDLDGDEIEVEYATQEEWDEAEYEVFPDDFFDDDDDDDDNELVDVDITDEEISLGEGTADLLDPEDMDDGAITYSDDPLDENPEIQFGDDDDDSEYQDLEPGYVEDAEPGYTEDSDGNIIEVGDYESYDGESDEYDPFDPPFDESKPYLEDVDDTAYREYWDFRSLTYDGE